VVKTPLVLVPGLLCDETVWAHQTEALADIADVQIASNGARDSLVAMAEAFLRRRAAGDNPWGVGATTLEWTLPSPPPFPTYEELPRIT